jgi:hypothetical protein
MTKNSNLKTFTAVASIVLGLAVAGTAIIVSAVRVESKVEHHTKDSVAKWETNKEEHKEMEADIAMNEGECESLSGDMIEIKTEIKYIRKDMNEILMYIRSLPK